MIKVNFYLFALFFAVTGHSQETTDKLPTYFGIQVKPVIPSNFIGGTSYSIQENGFESSIKQQVGFGIGGVVRWSVAKNIAIETGFNYTQRQFLLAVSVPEASVFAQDTMSFIEYTTPLNALFYVNLSEKIYMNAGLGVSVSYKPTNTVTLIRQGKHIFDLFGIRKNKFALGMNANFGFEYRTKKRGFFYLGGSARVPFVPLFDYIAQYNYDANSEYIRVKTDGSFLSIDFKYFFPLIKNKGTQFLKGPIE